MIENLYARLPPSIWPEEQFVQLLAQPGIRIDRIVSQGHASPPGFWYDQADDEWVLVLAGEALLRFEDEPEPRRLKPGDFVHIPAHRRHRVQWTHPEEATIWLAVFFPPGHAVQPSDTK